MKWSVCIQSDCDRVLSREEVVELADAVAGYDGIATGIGTSLYGASSSSMHRAAMPRSRGATRQFVAAAARAGLPEGPIVQAGAISEDEDAAFDTADPAWFGGWLPVRRP
jgi:hypothetical protein